MRNMAFAGAGQGFERAGWHGRGHGHGPHLGRAMLPRAAFGLARLAMVGGGRHGGPGRFGSGSPFGGGRGPFGEFPFGGPGGPRFGPFGGGPRAKRGDVRAGILALLTEEPRNGYQIIQELGRRSDGAWRPSSGAVYPALQQLEDEGLIRAEERDGKRNFALTDAGRAYVISHQDEVNAPWEALRGDVHEEALVIGGLLKEVALAAMQVVHTGNSAQIAEAAQTLKNTRRALYRILAEDTPPGDTDTPEGAGRA